MEQEQQLQWPISQAIVTFAERPDPDYPEFLSRVHLTFQDAQGGHHSTKIAMRTSDLAWALGRGETIPIHYCPDDPQQTWYEDQFKPVPRARRVTGMVLGIGVGVSLIAAMILMRIF